ncbi:MAG TPA: hemerythrin domain-containing protein [Verrucomicrobia bacterium]|nr:hemerythrin domain-containing protein [Verrucomicrobiota bacterium]HOP98902.1 hemerythrin domain-containing protein [Verrucomicrobiota bacterium]
MNESMLDHDHSELDDLLKAAFTALDDNAADRALDRLDVFWARLAVHIRAENIHLFPALLRAAESTPRRTPEPPRDEIQNTVAQLRVDHDFFMTELAAAMKELRALRQADRGTSSTAQLGEVRGRLERVRSRLDTHNALEEARAYRWVDVLLNPADKETLAQNIQRELENLPPRFKNPPPS